MSSRRKSTTARHEVQVAAAVAREAVLELHVEHAQALIRTGAGVVSEARMLEIYLRLLGLSGVAGEVVTTRVLATLGRVQPASAGAAVGELSRSPVREAHDGAEDDVAEEGSLLRTLRRRLRGRVHDELRRMVELQAGVVQVSLLELHVEHARRFVGLLADTHDIADACALYDDMVHVQAPLGAVLYIMVLDRLAAEQAPAPRLAAESRPEPRLASRSGHRGRARSSA